MLPIVVAAPLVLPGCQQVKEALGMAEEEAPEEVVAATPEPAKKAEPEPEPVIPVPIADEELPALPEKVERVDDLFSFVPKGEKGTYVILRHPEALLEYAEQGFKIYKQPLEALASAGAAMPEMENVAEAKAGFDEGHEKFGEAAAKIKDSGIDMAQGLVFVSSDGESDNMVAIFVAEEADAFKNLLTALDPDDPPNLTCQEIPDTGRMGCAESKAVLSAYKPDGEAAKHREAAEAALPGVALDEANIIAHFQDKEDGPLYLAMSTPPGTGVVHVSIPTKDAELRDAVASLKPVNGETLRYAQPGTGFIWASVDLAKLRATNKKLDQDIAGAPPPFDQVFKSLTGELFIGGSADPAGIQMHLGVSEETAWEAVVELAAMTGKGALPPEIPDIPGSKMSLDKVELDLGKGPFKALHLHVSGIPEGQVLAQVTGLTLDGWMYTQNRAATLAVGLDEANLKRVAATEGAGLSETTKLTVPKTLAESLERGEVGAIVHMPLDTLQGPRLRNLLIAALKNVEVADPKLIHAVLDMFAPVSSSTMWISKSGEQSVVHFAVRGIGNTSTEEGQEALAAMTKVLAGGSREEIYRALADKYPATSHTAAYQTRAGITNKGMLAGSGVGLISGMVAVGASIAMNQRNENLAADLGVTLTPEAPEKPTVKKPVDKQPDTKAEDAKAEDTKAEDVKTETKSTAIRKPDTKASTAGRNDKTGKIRLNLKGGGRPGK